MKTLQPTWDEIEKLTYDICDQMANNFDRPQYLIALMRGGLVPARIMADYFNISSDFQVLPVKSYENYTKRGKVKITANFDLSVIQGQRVIVMDDLLDSGNTVRDVRKYLMTHKPASLKVAALYWKDCSKEIPDYYAEKTPSDLWLTFPWEKKEFGRAKLSEK